MLEGNYTNVKVSFFQKVFFRSFWQKELRREEKKLKGTIKSKRIKYGA